MRAGAGAACQNCSDINPEAVVDLIVSWGNSRNALPFLFLAGRHTLSDLDDGLCTFLGTLLGNALSDSCLSACS